MARAKPRQAAGSLRLDRATELRGFARGERGHIHRVAHSRRETPTHGSAQRDGGSMNPPPPSRSNVSWWNVEHFHADWTIAQSCRRFATRWTTGKPRWPYAATRCAGTLQLSIARSARPIRSISRLAQNEDGLYAEGCSAAAGSPQQASRVDTLRSYRRGSVAWSTMSTSRRSLEPPAGRRLQVCTEPARASSTRTAALDQLADSSSAISPAGPDRRATRGLRAAHQSRAGFHDAFCR